MAVISQHQKQQQQPQADSSATRHTLLIATADEEQRACVASQLGAPVWSTPAPERCSSTAGATAGH